MCYNNGVKVIKDQHLFFKEIKKDLSPYQLELPLINGFDYRPVPVIKANADYCDWDIVNMEWGFIPPYVRNREGVDRFRMGYKDASAKFIPGITTLNATGEELLLPGKMYRDAALQRRCLFLSTGFYEWRHVPQIGKKGQPLKATRKIPYHIRLNGRELFYIAGIWQNWTDKDTGESVDTCALITTAANPLMEQIHNSKKRMPCILTDHLAAEWMSDGLPEQRITDIAKSQFPAEEMEAYTIRKDFREALVPNEAFSWEDVPALGSDVVEVKEVPKAGEPLSLF